MVGRKTRRSKPRKGPNNGPARPMAPAKPRAPKTPPQLPLDIIHNIGRQFTLELEGRIDHEMALDKIEEPERPLRVDNYRNKDLRKLTYASRSFRDILEPLLYRHVILMNPREVCGFFVTIANAPRLRQYVQQFICHAQLTGLSIRKSALPDCRKFWEKHLGSKRSSVLDLLDKVGLHKVAWAASMWERKRRRFMFDADFGHDAILELMFASTVLLLTNVQTFVWKDWDARPGAPFLTYILDQAVKAGLPIMPNLKTLNPKGDWVATDELSQFFMHRTHLWDNLQKLHLRGIDFDNEFTEMVLKGNFAKDLPLKELYVQCSFDAEKPYQPSMIPPERQLTSAESFDPKHRKRDAAKFAAFRNLDLLEIKFTFCVSRSLEGSHALTTFLHSVGAPERLKLIGHPLPIKALSTGTLHPRLKYLSVKEVVEDAPSRRDSKDNLVLRLNQLWNAKDFKRLVPNLSEIDWDHFTFRRKELEGEENGTGGVWQLENEDQWEDEDDEMDEDEEMDDDDGYEYGLAGEYGFDDGMDYEDHDFDDEMTELAMLENHYGFEELVNQLALHFHPPFPGAP